jgi:phosphoglycerate dehydrogenase-like enzyme
MKVLLTWAADVDETARVRAVLPADAVLAVPPADPHRPRYECATEDLLAEAADAEVLMGWVAPREVVEAATRLRLVNWLHAGCDQLDFELLRRRQVRAANVSGANDEVVAEQTMMFVLALAKNTFANHRAVVEGEWRGWWDPAYVSMPLTGKTLAVIGLGRVGTQIARRAKAFNMRVLGVMRDPAAGAAEADAVYPPSALHQVLAAADFVSIAVPLTPVTRNMIAEPELRAMKESAYLINVARGRIVAEGALHRALTEGWIAGFAADAWWDYADGMPPSYHFPVPSRKGVHKLPNVVASGDASANILMVKDAMIDQGIVNLAAYVKGEPLPREVDLEAGY